MANPEHLEILKQGVEAWNKWRKEEEEKDSRKMFGSHLDFSGENLQGMLLKDVNFSGVTFTGADLTHTDLRGAKLWSANLTSANLEEADLRFSNLQGAVLKNINLKKANIFSANLSHTDFSGANLSRASLWRANLLGANLQRANLMYAIIGSNILCDTDLTDAKGLSSCEHLGASYVDYQTLSKSRNLPLNFLRGCGLPDTLIEYYPSLVDNPIQFYSCFISFSSTDQTFADRLYADLQNQSVRCWFAPEDLKIGDKIRDRIDESIKHRDKLLLILSEYSIASDWVEHEVESALEEERQRGRTILFPIRLDDAVIESKKAWAALIRRTRHIGDFTRWKDHDSYQKSFERLLRDLKAEEKNSKK